MSKSEKRKAERRRRRDKRISEIMKMEISKDKAAGIVYELTAYQTDVRNDSFSALLDSKLEA